MILDFITKYWLVIGIIWTVLGLGYKLVSNHLAHMKSDIMDAIHFIGMRLDGVDGRLERLEKPYFESKKN